jgi:integrase
MAINKLTTGDKRWQFDWTTTEGTRKRKRFATKREAEEFQRVTLHAVRSGSYIDPKVASKTTVDMLYQEWIERIRNVGATGRKPASAKTLDNYRRYYENYVAPRWAHTPLTGVSYASTAEWITTLDGRDGRPAGRTTRREVGLMFGRLLGHAVKKGLLSSNPTKDPVGGTDYIPAVAKQREHVYLSMRQLTVLASAAGEFDLLIMMAGTCGLRWGEITALTADDVTFGARPSISVNKAYSEVGGSLILGATKAGERRTVPVPRTIAKRLEQVTDGLAPTGRLFSSTQGAVLRNSTWTKRHYAPAIARAAESEAGFPRPTFHDLRHTAVSLAISVGANVKVVQRIAGHASATMTLDTYAGLFDDDLHDSAGRLNSALASLDWN